MGWSYAFWKGGFYPKNLASKDFLAFYSKHLNSVEVNSTFYRIPKADTVIDWKNQTPEDFTFSLKFPAKITHIKMLRDCQEDTKVFLDRVSLLGEKLGVLLLQFPPLFGKQRLQILASYLKELPRSHRYAVEVRNESLLNQEVYAILKNNNIALVWVDSVKHTLAEEVTADFVYVRWEGDRKTVTGTLGRIENDRTADIKEWTRRLEERIANNELFGYFSKYYSGLPPSDAAELVKQTKP
jgi:uncharacterized protein YecE (DUF72 family)